MSHNNNNNSSSNNGDGKGNKSCLPLLESAMEGGSGGNIVGSSSSMYSSLSLSNDLALFLSNPTLKEALEDGSLDLASYSQTMEEDIWRLERECIGHYRDCSGDLEELKVELEECDAILGHFQELLLGFQADLSGLSGDIRHLQDQSRTLGVKLRNRKHAELGIRHYLQKSLLEPSLADTICRASVDANFVEAVVQLERKYQQTTPIPPPTTSTTSTRMTPSCQELQEHLYKLRLVATSRVRSYFLSKIAEARRPKTNVRMIQQVSLLKYVPLMDFLLTAAPDFYAEVKDVYVESMGKTLHALFRTYAAQLLRLLDTTMATRQDVLAIDEANLREFTHKKNATRRNSSNHSASAAAAAAAAGNTINNRKSDSFHLGARANLLENALSLLQLSSSNPPDLTCAPIVAHMALVEHKRYPYEHIFHSYMMHLLDAITNEYLFVRQFFQENGADAMPGLFSKTLSSILEQLENYLFNSYDSLALLLMIKLTHFYKRLLKKRNITYLDKFLEQITNLLWPRLKAVMDKHLRSIQHADPQKLLPTSSTNHSNNSSSSSSSKSSTNNQTMHAHYVSRRYAEFTSSILQILHKHHHHPNNNSISHKRDKNYPSDDVSSATQIKTSPKKRVGQYYTRQQVQAQKESAGDLLLDDLNTMQKEIVMLLERLSDKQSLPKHRIVFLINNYDLILSIFQERRRDEYMDQFATLLMQQRELFVEQELMHSFSKIIAFVQQTEQHFANHHTSTTSSKDQVNMKVVETLVRDFSSTWKNGIQLINANVLTYFSNFRNGMEILKQVLTQLLLYYTRFQDLLRKIWRNTKPPAFSKDLVPTSLILTEIKKYALAI